MSDRRDSAQAPEEIGVQVEHYWTQGYCCAEAMLLALVARHAPDRLSLAEGLGGGLCGGMGGHRATCGVFTGGAVALGLLADYRGPAKQNAPHIKSLVDEFHRHLAAEAGGQICEELLERMGSANADRSQCGRLTRRGAEILDALITAGRDER